MHHPALVDTGQNIEHFPCKYLCCFANSKPKLMALPATRSKSRIVIRCSDSACLTMAKNTSFFSLGTENTHRNESMLMPNQQINRTGRRTHFLMEIVYPARKFSHSKISMHHADEFFEGSPSLFQIEPVILSSKYTKLGIPNNAAANDRSASCAK